MKGLLTQLTCCDGNQKASPHDPSAVPVFGNNDVRLPVLELSKHNPKVWRKFERRAVVDISFLVVPAPSLSSGKGYGDQATTFSGKPGFERVHSIQRKGRLCHAPECT